MKKALLLGIVIAATLALCACGSTGGGTTNNKPQTTTGQTQQSQAASATTPTETAAPSVDYDLSEYTMDGTMNGGYSYTATLKIGPWVKASDTSTINSIWKTIGGSGSLPDIDTFTYNSWSSGVHFSSGSSIMAFGTMSVTDTTQGGFNIADTSNQLSINVTSPELDKALLCDSYVGYSGGSGNHYLHSVEGARGAHYILHVVPSMTSKNWGPVPFVICANEAISPENPDGKPEAMNATWRFGDNEFTVSPMWTSN